MATTIPSATMSPASSAISTLLAMADKQLNKSPFGRYYTTPSYTMCFNNRSMFTDTCGALLLSATPFVVLSTLYLNKRRFSFLEWITVLAPSAALTSLSAYMIALAIWIHVQLRRADRVIQAAVSSMEDVIDYCYCLTELYDQKGACKKFASLFWLMCA